MHLIVNAIFYLPAAAIAFALFYLFWRLGLRLCRINNRKAQWASLPVFVLLVSLALIRSSRSPIVYAEAFGFPVSQDVQELRTKRFLVGQSGGFYLRFKADEKTVHRILNRGLSLADTNQLFLLNRGANAQLAPKWWKPEDLGTSPQFYRAAFTNKNSYDWIHEYLGYDPATHLVLFKRDDID